MPHRPSVIDVQLVGKPALRRAVDGLAIDYGITVDEFQSEVGKLGIVCSRSAAARYRQKLRPPRQGQISPLLAAIVEKVFLLPRGEQEKLARQLGVHR